MPERLLEDVTEEIGQIEQIIKSARWQDGDLPASEIDEWYFVILMARNNINHLEGHPGYQNDEAAKCCKRARDVVARFDSTVHPRAMEWMDRQGPGPGSNPGEKNVVMPEMKVKQTVEYYEKTYVNPGRKSFD